MINYRSYCCAQLVAISIFLVYFIEALPQNLHRQGSIDEFLAIRTTTQKSSPSKPCIPQQFYPPRPKRSPHFNGKMIITLYPGNIHSQDSVHSGNSAKPPYDAYGGYFCANQKPTRPVKQPVNKPSNVRPTQENTGHSSYPNGVSHLNAFKIVNRTHHNM